ncbi:MAG: response regulator transcription factor [Bacteroidia bacterium]|nr:response regulator transcription factor [Bacteroidia bacterium]
MISVVIIDDEKKAREALRKMISLYCTDVNVLAEAEGVESGLEAIQKFKPDVILLDIKMKDGSGFDLVKKLVSINSKIIFVTAFHEFAIKAFKFSAIDYLLKPVDPEDLSAALTKAKESISKEKNNHYLENLLENFAGATKQMKKIALKTANNIYILNISDILYCKSDGNYTEFHAEDGRKALVSKTIGDYEEMLGDYNFLRVHHSFLVNLSHIVRFDKADGGTLIMKNGESIPVSSRKRESLIDALNKL